MKFHFTSCLPVGHTTWFYIETFTTQFSLVGCVSMVKMVSRVIYTLLSCMCKSPKSENVFLLDFTSLPWRSPRLFTLQIYINMYKQRYLPFYILALRSYRRLLLIRLLHKSVVPEMNNLAFVPFSLPIISVVFHYRVWLLMVLAWLQVNAVITVSCSNSFYSLVPSSFAR